MDTPRIRLKISNAVVYEMPLYGLLLIEGMKNGLQLHLPAEGLTFEVVEGDHVVLSRQYQQAQVTPPQYADDWPDDRPAIP